MKNPRKTSDLVLKKISISMLLAAANVLCPFKGHVTSIQSSLVSALAGCDENDPSFN